MSKTKLFILSIFLYYTCIAGDTIYVKDRADKRFVAYIDSFRHWETNERYQKWVYRRLSMCQTFSEWDRVIDSLRGQGLIGGSENEKYIVLIHVSNGYQERTMYAIIITKPSLIVKYRPPIKGTLLKTPKIKPVDYVTQKKNVKIIYLTNSIVDSSKVLVVDKDFHF